MPYRFFQGAFDPLVKGLRSYWKSIYLKELSDQAIDLITHYGMDRPDPKVLVHVPLMGGATSRVGAGDTAFGDRSAPWMLSVDGNWTDPSRAVDVIAWTRTFIRDLAGRCRDVPQPHGGRIHRASVVKEQFGGNPARLAELKKKYDPTNARINNNIRPIDLRRVGRTRTQVSASKDEPAKLRKLRPTVSASPAALGVVGATSNSPLRLQNGRSAPADRSTASSAIFSPGVRSFTHNVSLLIGADASKAARTKTVTVGVITGDVGDNRAFCLWALQD
jgi:hypothetical protein